MPRMKPVAAVALLADLVASREATDRTALHERVKSALAAANAALRPLDDLRVTVGDEFQGVFATLGEALFASYLVRLGLGPDDDVRFGIGRGHVEVIDRDANVQDGTAWWVARTAIEDVERRAKGAHRVLRTGLASAPESPAIRTELRVAVEAIDALIGSMTDHDRTILSCLLTGGSQADAAERLGISRSAVSQRASRSSIAVVADAITALKELK